MAGRPWTERELAIMRRDYHRIPSPVLGLRLGRTARSVYMKAKDLGLATQHRTDTGPAFQAELSRLNALGWADPEVAAALGCERHTVSRWRGILGLPARTFSERNRRNVAGKTAEQCRAAGVGSLAEVRVLVFRRRAVESGWPADLRPRAVAILDALAARGPMTRREIADAVGMPWKGSRASLCSNDPEGCYLGHLMARGLVVDLGRVVRGPGRGGSAHLYSLGLNVERSVQHA